MVSFRKSLMVVALLALCAGMAMAQTNNLTNVIVLRAEGVTEPLDSNGIVLSSALPTTHGSALDGNYSITVFSNTTNITSNTGKNDGLTGDIMLYPCAAMACTPVHGVVNASSTSVTFSNVTITPTYAAGPPATNTYVIAITGIRVNASLLTSGGPSFASGVSFTIFAQPSNDTTPAALFSTGNGGASPIYTAQNVAYAIPTFGFAQDDKYEPVTFRQCDTRNAPVAGTTGYVFHVNFAEGFSKSFQTMAQEGVSATQGTRLAATFTDFPTNVKLWVPLTTVTGGKVTPTSSPNIDALTTLNAMLISGAAADGSGGKAATSDTGWVAVTPGTPVIYEITQASASDTEKMTVPVLVSFDGLPALSAAAGKVTGSYAPISSVPGASSTAPIPRFAGPSVALTPFLGIDACKTVLLFPYVTTAPGWNVGLAISNTGATPEKDSMLGGTCAFSFYGAAGAPAAPVTMGAAGFGDTTPIASGSTGQDLATAAIGAGTSFTGYAFAVCNFTGAEGFAFPFATEDRGYISTGYLAKVVDMKD